MSESARFETGNTDLSGASMLAMIDSCFSNLVEQMDLGRNRHFFLRSAVGFTPVFRNAWTFY